MTTDDHSAVQSASAIAAGDADMIYRGLRYPYGREFAPETLEPFKIAEGVYWLRMPLPMKLDHINLWLLEDGDGWTVVDTCMNLDEPKALWEQLFTGFMAGKPLRRVIATHMHPDHVGLAGWLCERFDCELWMSRGEYLMCKNLTSYTGKQAPATAIEFLVATGQPDEVIERYKTRFGHFGKMIYPLPDSYRRLVDGETFEINGHYWQALATSGHSPEHISLYCPALKLMISGDQILPRITPNVSIFANEPTNDSLTEWLYGQERLRQILPDNLLILPSHQEPFIGARTRLTQIIESHDLALDKLYELIAEPRRVVDCFPALFKSKVSGETLNLAAGETLAHLNCLIARKMATYEKDERGVNWYRQLPEALQFERTP